MSSIPDLRSTDRGRRWRWWACCLLLLATMINYMDRLTLNLLATAIQKDLDFDDLGYARIEVAFALAFCVGAIAFGFLVDRWNVFWVYPLAVIAWSAAGLFSGLAQSFTSLLLFRFLLGLAESANWPCALRTTQRILPPSERSMGNSILQSGAALGAVLIPLVIFLLFDEARPSTWRRPFLVVGACGMLWVFLWWGSVRPADLALAHRAPPASNGPAQTALSSLPRDLFVRRFAALIVLVISINMTWHFLRAWLPKYLLKVGHSQNETNFFSSAYYVFSDVGALTAGFATLMLARRGLTVYTSRRLVFVSCAAMPLLCLAIPFLPRGLLLPCLLLVVGFGALGVFPNYYSFSQDLTTRHQGKVTGVLGCCCWLAMAGWQELIGQLVQGKGLLGELFYSPGQGSYVPCFIIAALAPLVGFAALMLLWGPVPTAPPQPAPTLPSSGPAEAGILAAEKGVKQG